MIMKRNLIVFSALFIIVSCGKENINLNSKLDSIFNEQSYRQSNTGIAVGIIQDGDIIYSKGFGYANLERKEKVTSKTLFHTGSIPKSFVSIALMQLVDKNNIHLDSLLIKYIPELKFSDIRYKQITIRHLSTHSSGMFSYWNRDYDKPKTNEDALYNFVLSLDYEQLRFNPGERFMYSDTNYDILGAIIYKVTGMPFEDYMKKEVLNKAGMYESTFYLPDTNKLAKPYINNYEKEKISRGILYPVNREHAPDGTLFSNINEMCNWMKMNIQRGVFNSIKVLPSEYYDEIWNPAYPVNWDKICYQSMGIGWFIGEFNGMTTYMHSGDDYGYRAIYCIIPEDNFGIVILSNYHDTPIHYLLYNALSYYYNDSSSFALNEFYPTPNEYPNIVGEYKFNDKSIHIHLNNDYLYAKQNSDSCKLFVFKEGGIWGKLNNNNWPFYYDKANINVFKEIDSLENTNYKVSHYENVYEKVKQ